MHAPVAKRGRDIFFACVRVGLTAVRSSRAGDGGRESERKRRRRERDLGFFFLVGGQMPVERAQGEFWLSCWLALASPMLPEEERGGERRRERGNG